MMRFIKHFTWTDWEIVGQQVDSHRNARYEVFRKINKNGLARYKKVKIVKSSCHPSEARIIEGELK